MGCGASTPAALTPAEQKYAAQQERYAKAKEEVALKEAAEASAKEKLGAKPDVKIEKERRKSRAERLADKNQERVAKVPFPSSL